MRSVEIIEDGLRLRGWEPGDTDAVHAAVADPQIRRWLSLPADRASVAAFLLEQAPARRAADEAVHLGVFDADTGALLGAAGLSSLDLKNRYAEIGFWTAPGARGRRVAERACRALLRWAFAELELTLVRWHAEVGNQASRLTARRLGFAMEGLGRARRTRPDGIRFERWQGSLGPADLRPAGPDSPELARAARQARVFGAERPVLTCANGVRLRPGTEADLDALVETARDAETIRWTTVPDPYDRAGAEWFLLRHAPAQWAADAAAMFVIADPDDRYAGSIDLRLVHPHDPGFADVGFMVAPSARGRGYAPAALRRLAGWGFEAFGLERIEWLANVGNEASRRVAAKAGFTFEGLRRAGVSHRGERRDVWAAGLVRTDLPGDAGSGVGVDGGAA